MNRQAAVEETLPGPCPARAAANQTADQTTLESIGAVEHPRCSLCGPANALGLKLKFRVETDGSVLATLSCREALQSYPDVLHGGVISALLDAAMTNALFSIGVAGVTGELTVRYLAPVVLNRGADVRAWIERERHPLYHLRAELGQDRTLTARASARFVAKSRTQVTHGERARRRPARETRT